MDQVEQINGYDEVDESTVFGGGASIGASSTSDDLRGGRRKGKKALSGSGIGHRGKSGRPIGGSFRFNPAGFTGAAYSMLCISVVSVAACLVILYFTFIEEQLPEFYGSLAASVTIVFLLCYIIASVFRTG